jgi:hypothetical protein
MSFSIIVSVGKYGGFYQSIFKKGGILGAERRICLGWIALSLLTPEFDSFMGNIGKELIPGWEKFSRNYEMGFYDELTNKVKE